MDWKSNLRRTQSLRSVPSSCDKPSWKEAGLRERITSVSQLVSRYQTTVEVSACSQETPVNHVEAKPKMVLKETKPSLLESNESHLESLMRRNDARELSRDKSNLTRSKSLGSLQSSTGSIGALKALFESKAATQNKVRSNPRAAPLTSTNKAADFKPVVNGDVEEVPAEEPAAGRDAKTDHVTRKVVNQTRVERRKTIGGIDFERIAASQEDEKRRFIADFRDSSLIQGQEKLCVSVKAMSALYLSKVVPQDSTRSPLKPEQDKSSTAGKRLQRTKMSEDSEQSKEDVPSARHQHGPEDVSGAKLAPSMPLQLSKEQLHQQRAKCELKRLLKHTHPELKMLDGVVDEELAEVLTLETDGETGYEGEVLSRCLIFENRALTNKVSPYAPKKHVAEGTVQRGDVGKSSAVLQEHEGRPCSNKTMSHDPNREGEEEEEEEVKIDVQATRRRFESQSVHTSAPKPRNMCQGKVSISGDKKGAVQKREITMQRKDNLPTKSPDLTNQPKKQGPSDQIIGGPLLKDETRSILDPSTIKTSAALSQNNPFIPKNIEREQSFTRPSQNQHPGGDGGEAQDLVKANVKNRAHLFESMPFDQIRNQNKDEIEWQVENIKETLNSLHQVNAIHSDGSIIEVNETMIAKKAKFTLSEDGPEIKYDEVAEGGAQNFILQLLPRSKLKPHITYLKEGSKGNIKATMVNVPVQHHHFSTNQDTEFKTANVAQLVEDILNQDNSLRKGVIIQEDADGWAKVIVYSLYYYLDVDDLKSYSAPGELCEPERDNQEVKKGVVASTRSCLLDTPRDQTCQGSMRPEITVKGNVKLFKSCIEKGDLEYLKTLQSEPTEQEQELPPNQNVAEQGVEPSHEQRGVEAEESTGEWVPVDIKRLKNMFSGDQRPIQPKQNAWENRAPVACASGGQNVQPGKSQSSTERDGKTHEVCNSTVAPKGSDLHVGTQDDGRVHQAELVEVVDNNEEISDLQTAMQSLHQATMEATSLHHSALAKNRLHYQEPISVTAGDVKQGELPHTKTCHKESNSETSCQKEAFQEQHMHAAMEPEHHPETITAQQEEEEVDFHGKLQAALDSLERSNINVSRGDFRAAMIYRSVSKTHRERSTIVNMASVQNPTKEECCPASDPEPTQATSRQEVSEEQKTSVNAEPESQSKDTSDVSEKSRRLVSPKPVIPPKPEHLKVKQEDNQSTNTKNPEATITLRAEETVPQPLPETLGSCEDKHNLFKATRCAEPGSVSHQSKKPLEEAVTQESEVRLQVQGSVVILETDNTNERRQQEINATDEEKSPEDSRMNETDESHVDFKEACKTFEGKKAGSGKKAPVKPKRVKIAQADNKTQKQQSGNNTLIPAQVVEEPQPTLPGSSCNETCGQTADSKDKIEKVMKQEGKVEMREKKGRSETEDERRQRLSVHMDAIMTDNMKAAMGIIDNLRKQEELQSFLSRVEEVEQDTSEVDVSRLRKVFEDVPDWVVRSGKKKQKKKRKGNKEGKVPLTNTESKSSMAHVFGDLERASEEIITLKEQTLARLVEIEETIKKALYSVSTLKSDSDIAGLSCLFKESLATDQGHTSSGGIGKISIETSRTKSLQTQVSTSASQGAEIEGASAKQQASPPSSPAFISIQSAAKKTEKTELLPPEATICPKCQHGPQTEERFRTTKTLTCNSPAQNRKKDRKGGKKQSSCNPKRELSVLEVQTDHEGKSIVGSKTVKQL
ncbi:hypothetical protein PBY51_013949 [Eleginops maclovinus]|uniref:Xin actin-binding repeat-containing protein 1-like n=1 Tax=Eleginops maclovinus TaxID=56733 RepID=A0AAN8AB95_ELEMC|nr:hypothetical protein PBY51_013949 [Eleginops maclovinus]